MHILVFDPAKAGGRSGFGAADEALDALKFGGIDLAGLFAANKVMDLIFDLFGLRLTQIEGAGVFGDKVGVAEGRLVPDGDVAGGLVGDVHFVVLFAEANEGTAH